MESENISAEAVLRTTHLYLALPLNGHSSLQLSDLGSASLIRNACAVTASTYSIAPSVAAQEDLEQATLQNKSANNFDRAPPQKKLQR